MEDQEEPLALTLDPGNIHPKCSTCWDLSFRKQSQMKHWMELQAIDPRKDIRLGDSITLRPTLAGLELSGSNCETCAILLEGATLAAKESINCLSKSSISIHGGFDKQVYVDIAELRRDRIEFVADKGRDKSLSERCGHISPTINSEVAAKKARVWLDECLNSHERCHRQQERPLPKRVICLTDLDSDPYLYEPSDDEKGDYIALSYCWGTALKFSTMQYNLASHKADMPWNKFPRTLKDAMRFTIQLGVRYVWIDALCIIQDYGHNDWAQQTSELGSIYGNALLTLSATASKDANDGCFNWHHNQTQMLKGGLSSAEGLNIYIRGSCETTHTTLFGDGVQNPNRTDTKFPILSRGWPHQERLLSHRILHCGPEELSWECATKVQCECSPLGMGLVNASLNKKTIPELKSIMNDHFQTGPSWSPHVMNDHLRKWQELLVLYSGLQFKYASDRSVALGGLAKRFEKLDMGPYICGLWGKNIAFQLDWVASPETWKRKRLQLPTWSWASVYAQSTYDYAPFTAGYQALRLCEAVRLQTDTNLITGETIRQLVLSSRAVDATLSLEKSGDRFMGSQRKVSATIEGIAYHIQEDIDQWPEGSMSWNSTNTEDRLSHGQAIVCMELSQFSLEKRSRTKWLVLKASTEEEGAYRRVGLIDIDTTWKDFNVQTSDKRTLRII